MVTFTCPTCGNKVGLASPNATATCTRTGACRRHRDGATPMTPTTKEKS